MYKYLLLFCCCFLLSSGVAFAQTTEEEEPPEDTEADRDLDYYNDDDRTVSRRPGSGLPLWYGAGGVLGFRSDGQTSFFQVGVSPIVGYKLNNFLSVGPRGSINYNRFTDDFSGFREGYVTWSVGAFGRALVYRPVFIHAEYSLNNDVLGFDADGPVRSTRLIPWLGGGLAQGGGPGAVGFEILILFRLTQADTVGDAPFEIRSGINYNF